MGLFKFVENIVGGVEDVVEGAGKTVKDFTNDPLRTFKSFQKPPRSF